MTVRIALVGLVISAVLQVTASGQMLALRSMEGGSFQQANVQPMSGFGCGTTVVPNIQEVATQGYSQALSRYQSCEAHRSQGEQWASHGSGAGRRNAARRSTAAAQSPKRWSDEELASSKFQAAHGLWKAGNSTAARRWLEVVVRDYSRTQTADRARLVLAKL